MRKGGQPTISATPSENAIDFREDPAEDVRQKDRYARQRLVPGWDQQKLAAARVVVAGAGAVGNETIKNLALLGVGRMLIVDFDLVEASNLSRCVLFREQDIGFSKAQAAAGAALGLNPQVEALALRGDIARDLGEGELGEYDLVLGCVDSIAARWEINRLCRRAQVPWLNAGIGMAVGEVSFYDPLAGACYECSMTRSMWHRLQERRSCLLVGQAARAEARPATAVLASLTASLLVQEAVGHLLRGGCAGQRLQPGEVLMLNTNPYEVTVVQATRNPHCAAHEVYGAALVVAALPEETTADALMENVADAQALVMERDVIAGWECSQCGATAAALPLWRLESQMLVCPECGGSRRPQLMQEVQRHSRLAQVPLQHLGVVQRARVMVRTSGGRQWVELQAPRLAEQPVS